MEDQEPSSPRPWLFCIRTAPFQTTGNSRDTSALGQSGRLAPAESRVSPDDKFCRYSTTRPLLGSPTASPSGDAPGVSISEQIAVANEGHHGADRAGI
jgi:hypothetical protein